MLSIYTYPYSPIQENTYLLYNENKEAIIIDPGCYYLEEKDHFGQYIADNKLIVKQILLTHCHLDHVFGLKWAAETFKLTPHYHPLEEKMLELAVTSGLMYNLPFDGYSGKYEALYHNQIITFGTDELKVLHLPGHSVGSVGFYNAKQHFIIAGDVLFYESIGRTDLPGGDMDILTKSIHEQLFVLPSETVVYNGHGQSTTIGYERKHNPFVGLGI